MPRKVTTETTRLIEIRDHKAAEMTQISDQMVTLQGHLDRLSGEVNSIDFALSTLDPSHVGLNAISGKSAPLLIEGSASRQPISADDAEVSQVADAAPKTVEQPAAIPTKKAASKLSSSKSKAAAPSKSASTRATSKKAVAQEIVETSSVKSPKGSSSRKEKSTPVPQEAVEAAAKLTAEAPVDSKKKVGSKEQKARDIVNTYMSGINPIEEIESVLREAGTGLTVEAIAEKFKARRPFKSKDNAAQMKLRNRISSQIAHAKTKGIVEGEKLATDDGKNLMHYRLVGELPTPSAQNEGEVAEQEVA